MEYRSLQKKMADKELLVKSDAMRWMLYTQQLMILFWDVNAGTHPFIPLLNTIAYSNCRIGIRGNEPIMSQIRKWQRIERLIKNIPPNTEEIPYSDIEALKIWENQNETCLPSTTTVSTPIFLLSAFSLPTLDK